ncbi:MAG TPA: acyl-CoA dehydrogenase family protein [Herpetosiphonaceae bacterium]
MLDARQIDHALIESATTLSQSVLFRWAADVDEQARFPHESVTALREAGLFGYGVPQIYGGLGGNLQTFWRISAALGAGCLSTALIWAMHCQQAAILVDHAAQSYPDVLAEIAKRGALVASVTTERGKGGHLFTADAPLIPDGDGLRLSRFAPVVSYGGEADYFLITARAGEDAPPNDVRLVLATPADGSITPAGDWQVMGMRGTRSGAMQFDLHVSYDRVLDVPFRLIALQSMVPVGHLGWAGAWYGAAKGAVDRCVRQLRGSARQHSRKLTSELFTHRLARLRMSLDLMEAMLNQTADRLDSYRQQDAPPEQYEDITHNIALNNLKVAVSELAFTVVEGLVETVGFAQGYVQEPQIGIERVFRDLRSAALMYSNDRLLEANGKLMIAENTAMGTIWQRKA